jgi:dihydrofolate synthase/folylpolyglutamate synthase
MTRFATETDAVTYIFSSLARFDWKHRGFDENTRNPAPTKRLLQMHNLLAQRREYAVVTGSKGKGSVTVFTSNLLKHLGHTVGTVTSPHLVSYRERIRVNGQAISPADFLRLVEYFAPSIDEIQGDLGEGQYLSPQGIFLAMALQYFDEQGVNAAVIEVGRGGRYDDNALVPNMLALFTPMILEHTRYLGPTLERIAWHKAGIIKPQSYAYSLPQAPEVMDVLLREAEMRGAEFAFIARNDMGLLLAETADGMQVDFGRYGVVNLPFLGRYEIDNASLAIIAAGNMHARLDGVPHASSAYIEGIRAGLESLRWPGRCQKLQDAPAVYLDGAINTMSVDILLRSLHSRLTPPVVVVTAVPRDRDIAAVYGRLAQVADAVVLTGTTRNVTIHFPDAATAVPAMRDALAAAGRADVPVQYVDSAPRAVDAAVALAGREGTVLVTVAQPVIGDIFEDRGLVYEQL